MSIVGQREGSATQTVRGVTDAFARWKSELLDLTKANRLLYFRPGRGALEVLMPDSEALFDGLVNRGRKYWVYRTDEEGDEEPEESEAAKQLGLLLDIDLGNGAANGATNGTNGNPEGALEEETRELRLQSNEVLIAGDAAVERSIAALEGVETAAQNVAARLGLAGPTALNQARAIQAISTLALRNPRPQREWFSVSRRIVLEELAAEAGKQQQVFTEAEEALRAAFDDEFFEIATIEFADRFEQNPSLPI